MKVNCQNKSICNHFDVRHFPTIKFFIDGHISNEEPGRDIPSILEYIQKLTTPSIIEIKSENEIKEFRSLYGENSFVVYYDGDKNTEWYRCIENIAEKKFKPYFYFGLYSDSSNVKIEDKSNEDIINKKTDGIDDKSEKKLKDITRDNIQKNSSQIVVNLLYILILYIIFNNI